MLETADQDGFLPCWQRTQEWNIWYMISMFVWKLGTPKSTGLSSFSSLKLLFERYTPIFRQTHIWHNFDHVCCVLKWARNRLVELRRGCVFKDVRLWQKAPWWGIKPTSQEPHGISGWWFQSLFIFHNIWHNPSHWRICSRWLKPPTSIWMVYGWRRESVWRWLLILANMPDILQLV